MNTFDDYEVLINEITVALHREQPEGMRKFIAKLESNEPINQKQLFTMFGLCSRWFDNLSVSIAHMPTLLEHDRFTVVATWKWPSLARLLLLLHLARKNNQQNYIHCVKQLCNMADVNESVVLMQSLAFIPNPEAFVEKAREAARSNMTNLFSAVAHQSDYAFRFFDDAGWNQLILKAAFMAVPIWKIFGLRQRNNAHLAAMLKDYARERQAASRSVPWDLWCCVAWDASEQDLDYLQQQFERGDAQTQATIAIGLTENANRQAQTLGKALLTACTINNLTPEFAWETIANFKS